MRDRQELKLTRTITRRAIRDAAQAYEVANAAAVPGGAQKREMAMLWAAHEALQDEIRALRMLLWGEP